MVEALSEGVLLIVWLVWLGKRSSVGCAGQGSDQSLGCAPEVPFVYTCVLRVALCVYNIVGKSSASLRLRRNSVFGQQTSHERVNNLSFGPSIYMSHIVRSLCP